MNPTFRQFFCLFSLFLGTPLACAPSSPMVTGIDPYIPLQAGVIVDPSFIGGTGTVLFSSPFASARTSTQINLSFLLPDAASLSLHTFSDPQLEGGVEVRFARNGASLEVTLFASGTAQDVSPYFSDLALNEAITLSIDVHNQSTPASVRIWNTDDASIESAKFDSTLPGLSVPGEGTGTAWGLTLNRAIVTLVHAGEPRSTP